MFIKGQNYKGQIQRSKSFPKMSMILKSQSLFNYIFIIFFFWGWWVGGGWGGGGGGGGQSLFSGLYA